MNQMLTLLYNTIRLTTTILITLTISFADEQIAPPIKLGDVNEAMLLVKGDEEGFYHQLPKLDTKVRIKIDGMVASTTVDQAFTNNSGKPIEAIYVFPLPDQAAVYEMQMLINDRLITSKVQERAQAKKTYEKAKKAGKRASLTEQERPNIFTNSVANIMPNDTIIVRLKYVDYLDYRIGVFSLRYPMVVGPRYIPGNETKGYSGSGWSYDTDQVRDASRITPPLLPGGQRTGNTIALEVDLETGLELDEISSVSHEITIIDRGPGSRLIKLKNLNSIPNRDFVLQYSIKQGTEPKAALFTAKKNNEDYFMLMALPPVELKEDHLPKEMIFVIDVSGSMSGESIRQAQLGLIKAINSLGERNLFNIIPFNDTYSTFYQYPVLATEMNKKNAVKFVSRLEAGGGTYALPALIHGMRQAGEIGAVSMIFFITDGAVGNENQLLRTIKANLGDSRLFCIGIGSAPNAFLLRKAAQIGRGTFTFISNSKEIKNKMDGLLQQVNMPVLTDIQLNLSGEVDLQPEPINDLFHGEPLLVFGKLDSLTKQDVFFTGRSTAGKFEEKLALELDKGKSDPAIPTLWARKKISVLMDEYRLGNVLIWKDIVDLALEHNLVTKFTSFVAVENRIINMPQDLVSLAVPTDLPAGWHYDKVLGQPNKPNIRTASSNGKVLRMASNTVSLPQTGTSYPLVFLFGMTLLVIGFVSSLFIKNPGR